MPPKRLKGKTSTSRAPPPQQTQPTTDSSQQETDQHGGGIYAGNQALLQEVAWCLDRLEQQIKQQNAPQRQVDEATKAWRNLSNPRTPLVKKRQIMRMMFGDYRATMKQEERQYSIRPQGMSITSIPTSKAPKSKYFKSSSAYSACNILESTTKDFQFGFSISEEPTASCSEKPDVPEMPEIARAIETSETVEIPEPAQNYYLLNHSSKPSAGFTFDFNVEQGNS